MEIRAGRRAPRSFLSVSGSRLVAPTKQKAEALGRPRGRKAARGAEELRGDEGLGEGRGVAGDEGAAGTRGALVQGARGELLADAGLAEHEGVPAAGGETGELGAELPGRGGLPDDAVAVRGAERETGVERGGRAGVEGAWPGVGDEDGDILYIEDVSGADEAVGGDGAVVAQGAAADVEDADGARLFGQELEVVPGEGLGARVRRGDWSAEGAVEGEEGRGGGAGTAEDACVIDDEALADAFGLVEPPGDDEANVGGDVPLVGMPRSDVVVRGRVVRILRVHRGRRCHEASRGSIPDVCAGTDAARRRLCTIAHAVGLSCCSSPERAPTRPKVSPRGSRTRPRARSSSISAI
jgi:hypothetical protein